MYQISKNQPESTQTILDEIEKFLLSEADSHFIPCENYLVFRAYFRTRILWVKQYLAASHIHQQEQVKEPNRPKEKLNRNDVTVRRDK